MNIRIGSTGISVITVQSALGVTSDGIFGKTTHTAVKAFQTRNGLVSDGIVGSKTMMKLTGNRIVDAGNAVKFNLTRFMIKEADVSDVHKLVNAIMPLFSNTPHVRQRLTVGMKTIFPYRFVLGLSSPEALANFFGQIRQEVGRSWVDEENLNYSVKGLVSTFRFYKKNYRIAELHGRTSKRKANQRMIANYAYANRMGNGDYDSGDGWRYRGMGSKMVTGLSNNNELNEYMAIHMSKLYVDLDFVIHPEKKATPEYSLLTGAIFWGQHSLGSKLTNKGVTRKSSFNITKVINKHTDSYKTRWNFTKKAAQLLGIKHEN